MRHKGLKMNPLIASIINNPSAHQVNRKEKMDKTIEVMADNLVKNEMKKENSGQSALTSQYFGYGRGRNTGD